MADKEETLPYPSFYMQIWFNKLKIKRKETKRQKIIKNMQKVLTK